LLLTLIFAKGGKVIAQERIKFKAHSWVNHIAFSPDGKKMGSVGGDRTMKVWDYQTQKCLQEFSFEFKNHAYLVEFLPAGDFLVLASQRRGGPQPSGWDVFLCDLKKGSEPPNSLPKWIC
jgi:WD40 repeat protein